MSKAGRRPFLSALAGTAAGVWLLGPSVACPAEPKALEISESKSGLALLLGKQSLLTFVHTDAKITRPFFHSLHAPDGTPLTRHHPPRAGVDLTDHDTFHPGLWLAFGNVSGHDYWRLNAKVKFVEYHQPPKVRDETAQWGATFQYLTADGKPLCREQCQITVARSKHGWRLTWDSTFTPQVDKLAFGDQEEMGLGLRMATPLMVNRGGTIRNSHDDKNEKGCWGKSAAWCDYSGVIDKRRYGLLLMPHAKNFKASSFHARDYGLLVANPFAEQAFGRGSAASTVVKSGETLRLRFGIAAYGLKDEKPIDAAAEFKAYGQ